MISSPETRRDPASYRDPSGYVFHQGGKIFRQINQQGIDDFQKFLTSGLADRLQEEGLLVGFKVSGTTCDSMTIEAEKIPFVTYPYEWSFSQLREAAIVTLKVNRIALDYGMILKDASAFNITFYRGKALFIDHTSFTAYQPDSLWAAYKQFCTNFAAPLYLMKYCDLRCLDFLKNDINGIALDFASRLLPWYSYFIPQVLFHIHLHGKFDARCSADKNFSGVPGMPLERLKRFIDGLMDQICSLSAPDENTLWKKYYQNTSYSGRSFERKKAIVREFCSRRGTGAVLDLGANTGVFSGIAAEFAREVIAAEMDPMAVEQLWNLSRTQFSNINSVRLDLFNPAAGLGLFNQERSSFFSRCRCDCVLGLALMHHLRVTGNWRIGDIVKLFAKTGKYALVEFVPLEDEQMRQLVRGRREIYSDWTLDNVTEHFRREFPSVLTRTLPDSGRVMIELAGEE